MSILDDYLKQKEIDDKKNDDFVNDTSMSEEEIKYYKKEIEDQRNSDLDIQKQYEKFHQTYVKKTETELKNENMLNDEDVKVVVRHVNCPQCGRELISKTPVIFNPFTMEKIAKHDCECGYKCNLEYAYPRVVFVNSENKEINAFSV